MQDIKSDLTAIKFEESDTETEYENDNHVKMIENNEECPSVTLIAEDTINANKNRFCLHVTGTVYVLRFLLKNVKLQI